MPSTTSRAVTSLDGLGRSPRSGVTGSSRARLIRLSVGAWCGVLAVASSSPLPAAATSQPGLHVYPSAIHLATARDRQSFVVQVVQPDGLTRDVTAEATVAIADAAKARLDRNVLLPVADGDTQLSVTFGGQSVSIPVHVERATERPDLSFRLDVLPVFMRAGCNSGACHGASRGKDGFRMSLFGFDPASDYTRITREFADRRINRARGGEPAPDQGDQCRRPWRRCPHQGPRRVLRDAREVDRGGCQGRSGAHARRRGG